MNNLTEEGIRALSNNRIAEGRSLLNRAIMQNANDRDALLWAAMYAENEHDCICNLIKILYINPRDQEALKILSGQGCKDRPPKRLGW
jgi:hypothetical protein